MLGINILQKAVLEVLGKAVKEITWAEKKWNKIATSAYRNEGGWQPYCFMNHFWSWGGGGGLHLNLRFPNL